ncbi:MAG TPA: hypothetical protein VMM92_14180, partial [Thermoanaerobaculia bacterium]|nr:hypothetical protein [Thermoanaerobaculia bacterium]
MPTMPPISPISRPLGIRIVGQDRLLTEAMVAWLAIRPEFRVIEPAGSSGPASRVDVVLLEASGPREAALAALWEVREELPEAKILPFGLAAEDSGVLELIEAG